MSASDRWENEHLSANQDGDDDDGDGGDDGGGDGSVRSQPCTEPFFYVGKSKANVLIQLKYPNFSQD